MAARFVLNKFESPGLQKERKERFLTKKKLLEENLGQDVVATPGIVNSEKITREALEEEARQTSLRGHGTPEEA